MDVSPELAELSRTVDTGVLGKRIKAARVAAGLTQTQLAAPEASTTYLSRIEHGDRRPDLRLLIRFAEKTRVTLDELVVGLSRDQQAELGVHLDLAAASLAAGEPSAALDELERIARAHEHALPTDIAAQARLLGALAHHALGNLDEAIISLEHVVEGGPTERHWLEACDALARCYADAGEPVRAVEVGDAALAVLARLDAPQSGPALRLSRTVADACSARGDRVRAQEILTAVGRDLDDDVRAVVAGYRAAARTALGEGNVHLAGSLGSAARVLLDGPGAARAERACFHLALAELLLTDSGADVADVATARTSLTTALATLEADSHAPEVGRVQLALARAHLLEGDAPAAARTLAFQVDPDRDPLLAASRLLLVGHVERREGRTEAARASLHLAVDALERLGTAREGAQVWFDLGIAFAELGESAASGNAYRRAASATGLAVAKPPRGRVRS